MATALPQKIILKSATTMSLNDRFSQIDTPPGVRIQISAQHQLNAKQQRMTRQMANRQLIVPSVSNIQQMQQRGQQGIRTSALLRLGNLRGRGSWPWRAARRARGMFGVSRGRGFANIENRVTRQSFSRGRGFVQNVQYQQSFTRGRRGWRGRGAGYSSSIVPNADYTTFRGRGRGRFGSRRGGRTRGIMGGNRGYYNYAPVTGGMRGQRRGWGRGRGQAWRRGSQPTATREQLDAQLDQYMTSADG